MCHVPIPGDTVFTLFARTYEGAPVKRFSMSIVSSMAAAAAFAQAPTITAVLDAGAYTSNLSPGIVFVVKGTNLCGTSATAAAPAPYTTAPMGGASISLTPVAGGAAISAYMVYCYNASGLTQLAAELPNGTAPGDYNVTVSSNGSTSAAFKTTVVARKFEILTLSGSGSGRATVTDANYQVNSFTTSSGKAPAKPTGALIVWGTGLGAAAGYDATAPAALDFLAQVDVKAIVGGVEVTPFFAGRNNVYPGLDNIGVPLPANVPTGCTVSFQIRVAGQLSNMTMISIAPDANSSACVDPQYSPSVLSKLDSGGVLNIGYFNLTSFASNLSFQGQNFSTRVEAASGAFAQYTSDTITQIPNLASAASGTCSVYTATTTSAGGGPVSNLKYLDAGAITLNGPNVSNKAFTKTNNVYSLALGTAITGGNLPPIPIPGFNSQPLITAGTYTVAGAGGADVGAFSSSINIHQPLSVTGGLPSTVNRSQNLTLNWTGSGSGDVVIIAGTSSVLVSGTPQNGTFNTGTFVCTTTGDKQTFTVPSSILLQLPASPAGGAPGSSVGTLEVFSTSTPTTGNGLFTAPLTAGGNTDFALFTAGIGTTSLPTYQ